MPSGFQSASLDENVLNESLGDDYELLNLTGCTREEILYMISSGYGVVVKTGANESLLLTGYDIFGNSWLYNPATGETLHFLTMTAMHCSHRTAMSSSVILKK